eukprot:scaffold5198_cov173-Amphora_coffeaeformis.AAC.11
MHLLFALYKALAFGELGSIPLVSLFEFLSRSLFRLVETISNTDNEGKFDKRRWGAGELHRGTLDFQWALRTSHVVIGVVFSAYLGSNGIWRIRNGFPKAVAQSGMLELGVPTWRNAAADTLLFWDPNTKVPREGCDVSIRLGYKTVRNSFQDLEYQAESYVLRRTKFGPLCANCRNIPEDDETQSLSCVFDG